MSNFQLAQSYISALTGSADTPMEFRAIHDQRKDVPAHHMRGTLTQLWEQLCNYNAHGYGIFTNINALDGVGKELVNITHIRTQVVDLDNLTTAQANYERAINTYPAPSFAVQSSPGKFHVYWLVQPYVGNDYYGVIQRKLRQLYDGDKKVADATRVLRVPGFMHLKAEPHMVTCWALPNINNPLPVTVLEQSLAAINVIENYGSTRHELGDPSMAAPSLEWLKFAMTLLNPNDLERDEWVSFTAAIKQAGWNHADEATLHTMWKDWCSQYNGDRSDEEKTWRSINNTEVGWPSVCRRTPVQAYIDFGHATPPTSPPPTQPKLEAYTDTVPVDNPAPTVVDCSSEILDWWQCQYWFRDCYFVESAGQIFNLNARFMDSSKFNGAYGGKHFVITSTGKTTDEAWKAALRSTSWTIPKVDHVRFLPEEPTFKIINDNLGRKGLNTYIPTKIDMAPGDITPWLNWLARILPNAGDRNILISYLAHCAKFPGYKIPWAPMLQSVEGIGKTIFSEVMEHILGDMYVYKPKAPELIKSGSTFNAWQRGKLFIAVDEIRIDEKRDLIEILKPMITDARIEIQAKGKDQQMEDNPANWLFFSNYKDAIPINQNGRRYCIIYSAMQSKDDLLAAGMNGDYFTKLWAWLREGGGKQAIAYYLMHYPINKGGLPVRAPESSSHEEAVRISRSPMEVVISDAVLDGLAGFRGGYVSATAALNRCKVMGGMRAPTVRAVQSCLESMGYVELGRAERTYMQEDASNRAVIYGKLSSLPVGGYGTAQGYE